MNDPVKRVPFSAPKGIPDYVPPASANFLAVRNTMAKSATLAGYTHIELPVFEETELFARGVGESTDVVSKEMYTFRDRGDRSVTLRPEGTAGVIRAVIEHSLDRGQLPVKVSYQGPFFRYERPQAGRYRQLQQVGVEAIGIDDPALDAEVVSVADSAFKTLGLTNYRLELTSLGDSTCRPEYRQRLQEFLLDLDLDEETRRRAIINPLRVLDDKRPEVREMMESAPLIIDYLSTESAEHFSQVQKYLDALGVVYVINPRMVRGLDYYTKTTFEFVHDGLGSQSGIGGGGRYDGLMAELGGQDLSGIGFGLGVDRALLACEVEKITPGDPARCEVFGIPLGDGAKGDGAKGDGAKGDQAKSLIVSLMGELRGRGVRTDMVFGHRGMKGSFKAADRSGALFAVIVGEQELEEGTAIIKDLRTGTQDSLPHKDVCERLLALISATELVQ